jgi:hypothetical protein
MQELILLVPIASWGGRPTSMYTGRVISPPPPAIASTIPAVKTAGKTGQYLNSVSIIVDKIIYSSPFFLMSDPVILSPDT